MTLELIWYFRQASVALNVWQPEVIRGWQKQMVGQCVVPVDARINALEMELRLCRQQIAGFDNAYVTSNPVLVITMLHFLNYVENYVKYLCSMVEK